MHSSIENPIKVCRLLMVEPILSTECSVATASCSENLGQLYLLFLNNNQDTKCIANLGRILRLDYSDRLGQDRDVLHRR